MIMPLPRFLPNSERALSADARYGEEPEIYHSSPRLMIGGNIVKTCFPLVLHPMSWAS